MALTKYVNKKMVLKRSSVCLPRKWRKVRSSRPVLRCSGGRFKVEEKLEIVNRERDMEHGGKDRKWFFSFNIEPITLNIEQPAEHGVKTVNRESEIA